MVDIATGKHLAKDMFEALGLGDIKWVTDFTLKVEDGVLLVQLEKVVLVEQIPPLLRVLQKYRFTPNLESEVEVPPSHKAANLLIPPGTPADLVELLRQSESTEEVEVSANLSDFVIVNLRVMGRASAAQLADYMAANRRSVANVLGELRDEGKVKPVGKTGRSGNEIVWELA